MPDKNPPFLAEARWVWRRAYVFAISLGLWWLIARTVRRAEPAALPEIAAALMNLMALTLVLYLVAPTAQQLAALIADLKLRLGGRA